MKPVDARRRVASSWKGVDGRPDYVRAACDASLKRLTPLEENVAAARITLSPEDLRRIGDAAPKGATAGPRYPEQAMRAIGR